VTGKPGQRLNKEPLVPLVISAILAPEHARRSQSRWTGEGVVAHVGARLLTDLTEASGQPGRPRDSVRLRPH
jgi:hypothetical protein